MLFTGLGSTTGEQAPLPQRTTPSGYWLAICAALNAEECRIDDSRLEPATPNATISKTAVPSAASPPSPGRTTR